MKPTQVAVPLPQPLVQSALIHLFPEVVAQNVDSSRLLLGWPRFSLSLSLSLNLLSRLSLHLFRSSRLSQVAGQRRDTRHHLAHTVGCRWPARRAAVQVLVSLQRRPGRQRRRRPGRQRWQRRQRLLQNVGLAECIAKGPKRRRHGPEQHGHRHGALAHCLKKKNGRVTKNKKSKPVTTSARYILLGKVWLIGLFISIARRRAPGMVGYIQNESRSALWDQPNDPCHTTLLYPR